jgi:hypothetical protein
MGMTLFIAAGLVFGSAGVPPVGSRGAKAYKITGETPALPKPLPKPSLNCVASAERKLVRNEGKFRVAESPGRGETT